MKFCFVKNSAQMELSFLAWSEPRLMHYATLMQHFFFVNRQNFSVCCNDWTSDGSTGFSRLNQWRHLHFPLWINVLFSLLFTGRLSSHFFFVDLFAWCVRIDLWYFFFVDQRELFARRKRSDTFLHESANLFNVCAYRFVDFFVRMVG